MAHSRLRSLSVSSDEDFSRPRHQTQSLEMDDLGDLGGPPREAAPPYPYAETTFRRKPIPRRSTSPPQPPQETKDNNPLLRKSAAASIDDLGSTKSSKKVVDTDNSWIREIAALIASILTFAALIGVLIRFNDHPLSDWKEHVISINTVISILAGISRVCLTQAVAACLAQFRWNWLSKFQEPLIDFDRFDAASRGPWGAFRLLRTMVRRPHWVIMGAFTTVFLIGFEPFLQTVVSFESVLFIQTGNGEMMPASSALRVDNTTVAGTSDGGATIGRSPGLDVGVYTETLGSPVAVVQFPDGNGGKLNQSLVGFDLRPDFSMMTGIWNGFSDDLSAQNLWPSFECTSGNCTWARFSSLAVCSKCADISHYLQKESGTTEIGAFSSEGWESTPPDVSNNYLNSNLNAGAGKVDITKYIIPSISLNISNYNGHAKCDADNNDPCPDTYLTSKLQTNPGQTLSFGDLRTMILTVQSIQADPAYANNKTVWEDVSVTAQECALYFCANIYEASVEQGSLTEIVVGSWSNRSLDSFASDDSTDAAFRAYTNYTLDTATDGLDNERTDLQVFIPDSSDKNMTHFSGDTFNISQSSIAGMLYTFKEGFNNPTETTSTFPYYEFDVMIYPARGPGTSNFMLGLGLADNVSSTFTNLASSLSKWMRDSGKQLEEGSVMQMVVVTRVHWYYMIWPGLTLLIGVLFAVLVILQTKGLRLPAWKANALVPLAHGADAPLRERLEVAAVVDRQLDEAARKMTVGMTSEGGLMKIGLREQRAEGQI